MTAKEILFQGTARRRIARGLDSLANAVKVTLGPRGRNVVIERPWGAPIVTKDGVTVAKEIELEDRFENMGAQMVKEVASRTAEVAGDGTTTATVLAQAIYAEGAKLVTAGVNPMDIKRGIETAVETVVAALAKQSRPIEGKQDIAQVGLISSNGDETIGDMIAEAMEKVGKEGVITIEEARSIDTTLEVVEGMRFDRGYVSPYFVTDTERMEAILTDAYLLVHEKRISSMQDLLPLLEQVASAGKPLLVLAEDIDGEALATLVVNKLRGALHVCAVKAPGFGDRRKDILGDIAAMTGAKAVTEDLGLALKNLTLKDLGRARTITVTKDTTTLMQGAGKKDDIQSRAAQIRSQIESAGSDHDRDKLQERLARLLGGVAVIKVGAATETEMKEKKARVEDALNATRAAVEEGIVAGGGVALLRTLPALAKLDLPGDQKYGVNIVRRALEEPLRQIAGNGGHEGAVVLERVRQAKGAHGFNAATGAYEDLLEAGIMDPTKVVRAALQNAASVASLMLTTEALVAERRRPRSGAGDDTGGEA